MRDPLIPALGAVVAGILIGRWLGFSVRESAWPILAFFILAALAHAKGTRWLTLSCLGFAMVFVGGLAEAWHRPGAPPEIDAGSRETVILEGCVVEPTVFSADREQFTLELDPGARARVSLPLRDDRHAAAPRYGQRVEIDARVRRPRITTIILGPSIMPGIWLGRKFTGLRPWRPVPSRGSFRDDVARG